CRPSGHQAESKANQADGDGSSHHAGVDVPGGRRVDLHLGLPTVCLLITRPMRSVLVIVREPSRLPRTVLVTPVRRSCDVADGSSRGFGLPAAGRRRSTRSVLTTLPRAFRWMIVRDPSAFLRTVTDEPSGLCDVACGCL